MTEIRVIPTFQVYLLNLAVLMNIRVNFDVKDVYIRLQHHIREIDPMIEIELQQDILHTILDH